MIKRKSIWSLTPWFWDRVGSQTTSDPSARQDAGSFALNFQSRLPRIKSSWLISTSWWRPNKIHNLGVSDSSLKRLESFDCESSILRKKGGMVSMRVRRFFPKRFSDLSISITCFDCQWIRFNRMDLLPNSLQYM
jgi:hypothetical protein